MHFQLKKTITHVTVLSALLPVLPALAAEAGAKLDPAQAPKQGQYVYDSFGSSVRTDVTHRCVGTGYWTPESATVACDPNMFASPAAPAPRAAAPPPKQPAPAAKEEPVEQAAEPEPAPEPEPAMMPPSASDAPEGAEETIAAPIVFYDGDEGAAKDDDITGRTEYTDEGPASAQEEGIAGVEIYREENEGVARDDGITTRNVYEEEDEGAAKDEGLIARSEYNEDDEGVAKDEGITGRSVYNDDSEGAAKDEGLIARSEYTEDDEGVAKDEGITGSTVYNDDNEGAAKDEGITGSTVYNDDDEGAAKDEGITARSEFTDDNQGVAKDEGITGHQVFNEDNLGTTPEEGITAQNVYSDEDSGRQPDNLVSEPKTVPETTAQTEQQAAPVQQAKPATARQEQKPVTMLPVTVTVEAEPLFDFDKYAIRADSRKKLDDLVEQLKGVAYGEILTIGFADPIGPAMYNQRLSERRAAAVKQYLEGKGIPANTIRAEGRGETEEYASYQDCGGMRKQKLIACLQPDRRVEVTVTAEKQK